MDRTRLQAVASTAAVLALLAGTTAVEAIETDPERTPITVDGYFSVGCDITGDGQTIAQATTDGLHIWLQDGLVETVVPTPTIINRVDLSDDGRYATFGYLPPFGAGDPLSHVWQYDIIADELTRVSNELIHLRAMRTSADGSIVIWGDVFPRSASHTGDGTIWVWDRATGSITTTTLNDPGTDLPDADVEPYVVDAAGSPWSLWWPMSGEIQSIVPPTGLATASAPVAVNADGSVVVYQVWVDDYVHRLTAATTDGTIIAETTKQFGGDNFGAFAQSDFTLSVDGERLLVQSSKSTNDTTEPQAFVWEIGPNKVTDLNLPGLPLLTASDISQPAFCGSSPDLRFAVARLANQTGVLTSPEMTLTRLDLERFHPRTVTVLEVSGSQLSDQIHRLYQAYLQRDPDQGGLQFWIGARARGTELSLVSEEFANSAEFTQRYGALSNREFVLQLYANVLEREPDEPGVDFWTALLDGGMTRGAVMIGFSEAPEFVSKTATSTPVFDTRAASLNRIYWAFFQRDGDDEGLTYWFHRIRLGGNLDEVAESFANSAEFQATYGNLSNEEFVDLIYDNVLGRPAEDAGRSFWISVLDNGATRGEVMLGFSESPEFIVRTDSLPRS